MKTGRMNLGKWNTEHNTKIFVNGMSLLEISKKYNIALGTVQQRYRRGLRTLEQLTRDDNLHNDEYRIEIACGNGKRFLKAAMDKHITIREISERSGVTRNTIWNFVYNNADISGRRLARLCGVIGVSMDYVMGLKRSNE